MMIRIFTECPVYDRKFTTAYNYFAYSFESENYKKDYVFPIPLSLYS